MRTSKTATEALSGTGKRRMYACCHARHPESGLKQERLSVWLQKVKLSLAGQIFKLVKSSSSGGNALKKKKKKLLLYVLNLLQLFLFIIYILLHIKYSRHG